MSRTFNEKSCVPVRASRAQDSLSCEPMKFEHQFRRQTQHSARNVCQLENTLRQPNAVLGFDFSAFILG